MKKIVWCLLAGMIILLGCGVKERERHEYAYVIQEAYQDAGFNIRVEATGYKATVFEITGTSFVLILMASGCRKDPEGYFDLERMRKLGFTKIIGRNRKGRVHLVVEL